MKTSKAGRNLIAQREGNRLKAYPDPATGGEPWTIGVGHTSAAGPPKVKKGMTITAAESDEILTRDLVSFENAANRAVKVPLNQNEFDALVSLAFNIGGGAFAKSTLVKKLNAGDRAGAADAFLSWNKAAGKVMAGLTTRRKAERQQFLSGGKLIAKPSTPKPTADAILKRGSTGDYVKELQAHLNAIGYGPLTADGNFGKATEDAVIAFQKELGLEPDGWAGPRTLAAIGKALKEKEVAPKLDQAKEDVKDAKAEAKVAEKTVPPTATKEVKEKTNLWSWLLGLFGVGGGGASALAGAEWQTVLAIGGVAIVALIVLFLMRRQIIAAFRDINSEARG